MRLPPEELWAYWSRYIYINRYMNPPKPVYEKLFELVRDKDYFVLTTNVDHCFQKVKLKQLRRIIEWLQKRRISIPHV